MYPDPRLNRMVVGAPSDYHDELERQIRSILETQGSEIFEIAEDIDDVFEMRRQQRQIFRHIDQEIGLPTQWRAVSYSGARVGQKSLRVSMSGKDWQLC